MLFIPRPPTETSWLVVAASGAIGLSAGAKLTDIARANEFDPVVNFFSLPATALVLAVIASVALIELDQAAVPQWLWRLSEFFEYARIRDAIASLIVAVGPARLWGYGLACLVIAGSALVNLAANIKTGRLQKMIEQALILAYLYRILLLAMILGILAVNIGAFGLLLGKWLFALGHAQQANSASSYNRLWWTAVSYQYGAATIAVGGLWFLWFKLLTGDRTAGGISLSGIVLGAAQTATRGKAALIGLFFLLLGSVILLASVPALVAAVGGQGDWILPVIGTAIGGYLFLARGLGPTWTALSWSSLSTDTHGQSRTARATELRAAGAMPRPQNAVYLGRFVDERHEYDEVGYAGGVHLVTIGPAGSGKGTGLIVPNLSTLRSSILIIDPKAEAAAITARRREQFGPVFIINPFNVLVHERPYLQSTGFNPLAALNPDDPDNFTDDCSGIGLALVKDQGGREGAFFTGSARELLTALVMHEKWERREKASLANVRKMLTEPYDTEDSKPVGLLKSMIEMATSPCEPLRMKAGRFLKDSRSNRDIISTAINETQFLDSPPLQRDLLGEAIKWDRMKDEVTTVYLILPADRLDTHANYLRLVVTSALRELLRSPPSQSLPPVLFMLDEFAQLGYLPPIENAMAISRGFGVALWPFLQDLNQLKALYKDRWETFLGNAEAVTAFAPRDLFTARHLSSLCGQKTVIVESESERSGSATGRSRGPQGLPLFRPEGLMGMPARQMLCLVKQVEFPFMTRAPAYTETPANRGLDSNPYHRG